MTEDMQGRYNSAFAATLAGIMDLFRKQKNTVSLGDDEQVDGKHVLITGASSGLGLEAALQLAKRGANVWMVCRSGIPEKGEYVKRMSGNEHVHMLHADLSDLDNILALVDQIKSNGVKFDIVIENAAVVPAKSRQTKQGLEEMFVVNFLSKYMLVRLLLEHQLLETGSGVPRIIFVSSESHRNPKGFDWEGFGKYKSYTMGKTVELYGYYKLLMTTFANELSRRLNPEGQMRYAVFALCPGPINSNIAREAPAIFKPLLKLVFGIFFRSPHEAVKPVVYFSCSREVGHQPVDYLFLMSRKDMDAKATDVGNGQMLWEKAEELLKSRGIIFQSAHTYE